MFGRNGPTHAEAIRLQRQWDSIHRRLVDLAACRVMPAHVDRYEREQRLLGMLDAIEYRIGTAEDVRWRWIIDRS